MRRYDLSEEARQDLIDIRTVAEACGARVARHVLWQIRKALELLSRTPGAGHIREDVTDAPVKFLPVSSYLIVYRPTPAPIGIIRVLHGSRDLATMLSSGDE